MGEDGPEGQAVRRAVLLVFAAIVLSGCISKPKIVIFDTRPDPGELRQWLRDRLDETRPVK